jgi:glyoxylase-like metal-dependent hydrolase (beta-lactamase superfamily II)
MATRRDLPVAALAQVHVLFHGYAGGRVASTVTFIRDGDLRVIVDPGMVPSPASILDPLVALGESANTITDVVFSHHHPDHTMNAGLFPAARCHDHQAVYQGDLWTRRPADGHLVSPSIRLLATPGHTAQDITTLVGTANGIIACTHLWWNAHGPADDPLASDVAALHVSRSRVLQLATLIVPGHGAPFTPDASTPR